MFSEKEIEDALSVYEMEDEFFLNDDAKIMFFRGNAGYDVQLWCWVDDGWITHEQVTIIGTGDPKEDRKHGIWCVMERAEALKRKFRFSQTYQKTTTWREYYDIEAESLEEAREKAAACDGDLDGCEDAEFVEAEQEKSSYIDDYQYRGIDTIYDPEGEEVVIRDRERISRAEQVLVDNGIDADDASTVLQALGYVLIDTELYPD